MNLELVGNVGDEVYIKATITEVKIDKGGVKYCINRGKCAKIEWVTDKDITAIPKKEPAQAAEKKEHKIEPCIAKPETPAKEPEKIKRRPGRPKKATVEETMAKYEAMKAMDEV